MSSMGNVRRLRSQQAYVAKSAAKSDFAGEKARALSGMWIFANVDEGCVCHVRLSNSAALICPAQLRLSLCSGSHPWTSQSSPLVDKSHFVRCSTCLHLSCTKQLHPSSSQKMVLHFLQIPPFFIVIALINTLRRAYTRHVLMEMR